MPKDEADIVAVVNAGTLTETHIFEAKAQITSNMEMAKDICAMTVDGGVIIYGIGEDQNKRLTILSPLELAGQPERISAVVRTSIDETPTVHVHPIPKADDPAKGYIVVEIPASARAPHMVIASGKYQSKYYGRTSNENIPLSEGEVARLYARRQQMEIHGDILLQQEIDRYPFTPSPELAYLYFFCRPIFLRDGLLEDARKKTGSASVQETLYILVHAASKSLTKASYSPYITSQVRWERTVDGYRGDMNYGNRKTKDLIRLEVDENGCGHMFCGRIANKIPNDNHLYFIPETLAGNVAQFSYLFGFLYDRASYNGLVDVGVAVIGLKGCVPLFARHNFPGDWPPYEQNEYRRTLRGSAQELYEDPASIAKQLTMPLINAITRERVDPFKM